MSLAKRISILVVAGAAIGALVPHRAWSGGDLCATSGATHAYDTASLTVTRYTVDGVDQTSTLDAGPYNYTSLSSSTVELGSGASAAATGLFPNVPGSPGDPSYPGYREIMLLRTGP